MISPNVPENEDARLHDLYRSNLLDTPEEKEFNEIVLVASDLCAAPISLITLVDVDRQWFKARVGLDITETDRDVSFCGHAILQDDLFEVPDALLDLRFRDNPLVVNDPLIRFYAGVPLITDTGSRLGTLCVIDRIPRHLTDNQRFALKVLASNVIKIAELRIKNRQLHAITETQKRIISIVAHDVRNPLAAIKSVIDLREEEYIDEKTSAEMLDIVNMQLDNTLEMVENVVNWGQMQLSGNDLILKELDLYQVVDEVFTAEMLAATKKHNTMVNQIAPGTLVKIDKQVMKFILRNLLSNANKFTKNGSIVISATQIGKQIKITVADNGVGMEAEKVKRVFFSDESNTSLGTNNEKGSGLGLLLVKEFIDDIKGSISVESEPGLGTRFIVSI